jgi:hypothetical protein
MLLGHEPPPMPTSQPAPGGPGARGRAETPTAAQESGRPAEPESEPVSRDVGEPQPVPCAPAANTIRWSAIPGAPTPRPAGTSAWQDPSAVRPQKRRERRWPRLGGHSLAPGAPGAA